MADTDVLVADTVPVETEAPEPQDTAEVETTEGTDTEGQGTDTRDFEAEKAKAVEEARTAAIEEARKSFEDETILRGYRERTRNSEAWLATQAASEAQKFAEYVVGELESGRMTGAQVLASIKPENLKNGWAGRLAASVQSQQLQLAYELQDRNLARAYPNWRVPADLARAKELAISRGDAEGLYTVRDEIWLRALRENEVPVEAKKLAATEAAKDKKAGIVEKALEGDKARAGADRPTAVGSGRGAVAIASFNDAAAAYNKGLINGQQYAAEAKRFGVPLD